MLSDMKIDTLPIGMFQENIYILHDNDHVLIIDPGKHADVISRCISSKETVDAVLLTHGHSDHTGAADDTAELYQCPVYIHPDDRIMIDPSGRTVRSFEEPVYSATADLMPGKNRIGSFDLEILHTPGHTKGSVMIRYRNVLFSGDTLFAGSIGRTDLFGGDEDEMTESIRMILNLPNDLKVLPGHGPASTIGMEKKVNPYLKIVEAGGHI